MNSSFNNNICLFYLLTIFLSACGSDTQSKRRIGDPINGKWSFGVNPDCTNPKSVITISNKKWNIIGPEGTSLNIINIKYSEYKSQELLVHMTFNNSIPQIREQFEDMKIYFKDEGNKLSATAMELKSGRVSLEALEIDIKSGPFFFLTRC